MVSRTEKFQREFYPVAVQTLVDQVLSGEVSAADEFKGLIYPNKLILLMSMVKDGNSIDQKN